MKTLWVLAEAKMTEGFIFINIEIELTLFLGRGIF